MSIWLLEVKGSLHHLIEKLGVGKSESELTEPQRLLRRVAQLAGPEQPTWASGAFIYLMPGEVDAARMAIGRHGVQLQSKHILVSPSLKPLVTLALAATPDDQGREGFLLRRAGTIITEEEIRLDGQ